MIQKIRSCLWFDDQAEEAVSFYTSIFPNSRIGAVLRYDKASSEVAGRPEGSVLTIDFELDGEQFVALNGGPAFHFSEAISFVVSCKDQAEVDEFWDKLSAGGDPESQQCGWLKDKFDLSWQIVPDKMQDLLSDPNPDRAQRAMKAMLQMKKLDIASLQKAADGN